ncbi:transketolase, thiamine diphosphate binding domain protein, partial [Chlamydia psittaci 06-1683]
TQPKRYVMD